MKFRTRPAEVDLVVFRPQDIRRLEATYPRLAFVDTESGGLAVYNDLHQSPIQLEDGDYVNVTTPGDYYPIKAEVVAATYEPIPEPEP